MNAAERETAEQLEQIKVKFPGWIPWHGSQSNAWWVLPPAGFADESLISADSLDALAGKIADAIAKAGES